MAEPAGPDALGARQQLVAVLRVVVEARGRVVYGDVVDPETDDKTTFVGSSGVGPAVDTWVKRTLRRRGRPPRPAPDGEGSEPSRESGSSW